VGGRSSIGSSGFSFTLMTRCWTGLMVGKMLIYIASKACLQLWSILGVLKMAELWGHETQTGMQLGWSLNHILTTNLSKATNFTQSVWRINKKNKFNSSGNKFHSSELFLLMLKRSHPAKGKFFLAISNLIQIIIPVLLVRLSRILVPMSNFTQISLDCLQSSSTNSGGHLTSECEFPIWDELPDVMCRIACNTNISSCILFIILKTRQCLHAVQCNKRSLSCW